MALPTIAEIERQLEACKEIGKKPVRQPRVSRPVDAEDARLHPENYVTICVSNLALRCKAQSKQQKRRCMRPASKGMQVCRFHGGAPGTGVITAASQKRQIAAVTIHGRETNAKRRKRSQKAAEFRVLERVMRENNNFQGME